MKRKLLIFAALGMFAFSSLGFAIKETINEKFESALCYYDNHDADTYYEGISDSLEGTDLLKALQSLNKSKRQSTVGYSAMSTSSAGMFKYTDYDPATVKYDSNGQPYGTSVLSFYSGNSCTSFNREHVWPNTHGGNKVENDIHMPRPTIPTENGSRSHSFYVEGVLTKNGGGWDPAMESFGKEDYRGDSARIIFYCMVASNQLVLTDDASRSSNTSNNEMGVISDMLSWNLRYPVLEREMNRNEGAEYLQGNRNPFIDHPEYACRIWGKFNEKTQQICSSVTPVTTKTITIKENGKVVSNSTINANESKTFEAYVDGEANSSVSWSLLKDNKTDAYSGSTTLQVNDGKATVLAGEQSEILYLKASFIYDDNGTNKTITAFTKITVKGSGLAPVEGATVTYTVNSVNTVGVIGEAPAGTSAAYSQTYSTAGQITGGKSATLSLSGYEGYTLTGIKLNMHANSKSGAGSFTATAGTAVLASTSGEFNTWYDNTSYGTNWRDINVELDNSAHIIDNNEKVALSIEASSNSLYINSFTLTFSGGDNPYEPPEVTFESIEVVTAQSKTEYQYGEQFVKPYVLVKYSDGESEKASDDNITCTGFNSAQSGRQTITVTYKNGEDEGTTTYVVTVAEKPNDNPGGDTPSSSNGCGGNIATASIILSSLALAGIILVIITKAIRKKKSN